MADFVNTIDLFGDEAVASAIIDKTIAEFNDNVLTALGQYALYKCTALTSVNLPNVTTLGQYALSQCTALINADLPNITSFEWYCFQKSTSLTSANFPNLTSVGDSVFDGCTSLTSVNLPLWNPNHPVPSVFQNCSSLPSIDLPKVARIGTSMFSGCTVLKTVILRVTSVCSLSSVNAFDNTPFSSSGTGGTVLVPASQVAGYSDHTNWSAILAQNANNRALALEDYTIDGTITGEIDWDKLNGGN